MRVLRRLVEAVRASIWHEQVEQDLDAELRQDFDALVDEGRRAGLNEAEAIRAARLELGSVAAVKDRTRDVGWETRVEGIWRDVRYAARTLRRLPGFSTAAIGTLGSALGLNILVFSLANAIFLKPLPYRDSDRLVWLVSTSQAENARLASPTRRVRDISVEDLLELRLRATTLASMGVYVNDFSTMTRRDGTTIRLGGSRIEPQAFEALGAAAMIGRLFRIDDTAPGAEAVVLLSYQTWRREFGGDRAIIGSKVTFDGQLRSVIGVMPPEIQFPFEFPDQEFWKPLALDTATENARKIRLPMLGRLAVGASPQTSATELTNIFRSLHADGTLYELVRVRDEIAQPVSTALGVLSAGVGCLLLIACVNIANLLLARSETVQREIAIRSALGAGRGRLVWQRLAESLLLATFGAGLGVMLAFFGMRALRTLATTLARMDVGQFNRFPRLEEVSIDASVVAYTLVTALFAGVLCGIVPALRASRLARLGFVRDRATASGLLTGRGGRTWGPKGYLVVGEIALAMLLLVGGGLLLRSFLQLANVPVGYEPSHVLTFQVALPGERTGAVQIQAFAEEFVGRLRNAPDVQAAAYVPVLPLTNLLKGTASLRRSPQAAGASETDFRGVSVDYFKTMGIRVRIGREFNEGDGKGRPPVIVINQSLADRDFAGVNAVGQMVYLNNQAQPWEVIGIVDNVRQVALDEPPRPQVFVDCRQWSGLAGLRFVQYYAVRTAGAPMAAAPYAREILKQLDARAALYNVAPMEQLVSNSVSRPRLYTVLAVVFAGVAVVLAATGLFGLVAYLVAREAREIGVRLALGASPGSVVGLLVRQHLLLAGVGILIGLAAATAMSRVLRSMLFQLTPFDPFTFLATSALFLLVAATACYLPARRAAKVDPLVALRSE